VHRDLKPANVLLSSLNPLCLKVTDFGLAKEYGDDASAANHTAAGTPLYCAPEQCTGNYGLPVDVFALGIMTALAASQLDLKVEERLLVATTNVRRIWPRATILLRMIAVDPSKRPTISEVLNDSWTRLGVVASDEAAKEEMVRLREENRGLSPLQSAVLKIPTLHSLLVDEALFLMNVAGRGGALALSLGLEASWKAHSLKSQEEGVWQSLDFLLKGVVNMKAQLLTSVLKKGGRIGGSKEGNGYHAKHALDKDCREKVDGETDDEKKKREEENKSLKNAETSRKQKWMMETTELVVAIRIKMKELKIDDATSFVRAHSIVEKAIDNAFLNSASIGFREISNSARGFLSTLLATVHVAEGTRCIK